MKTLSIILASLVIVSVASAEANLNPCMSCHGQSFEKPAMDKSKILKDMTKDEITVALKGYQTGTYGGDMKKIMQGQVLQMDDARINEIASTISKK